MSLSFSFPLICRLHFLLLYSHTFFFFLLLSSPFYLFLKQDLAVTRLSLVATNFKGPTPTNKFFPMKNKNKNNTTNNTYSSKITKIIQSKHTTTTTPQINNIFVQNEHGSEEKEKTHHLDMSMAQRLQKQEEESLNKRGNTPSPNKTSQKQQIKKLKPTPSNHKIEDFFKVNKMKQL